MPGKWLDKRRTDNYRPATLLASQRRRSGLAQRRLNRFVAGVVWFTAVQILLSAKKKQITNSRSRVQFSL